MFKISVHTLPLIVYFQILAPSGKIFQVLSEIKKKNLKKRKENIHKYMTMSFQNTLTGFELLTYQTVNNQKGYTVSYMKMIPIFFSFKLRSKKCD